MDFVAGCARDLVLGVATLQSSDVRRLVQVTAEANLVGCGGDKFRGIAKEVFESLGGGEAFIRSEREAWGSGEDR